MHRGVVKQLFDVLPKFRAQDDLLADVYAYVGASLNFDLASNVLNALTRMLAAGASAAGPALVKHFGLFGVDQLQSVLDLMVSCCMTNVLFEMLDTLQRFQVQYKHLHRHIVWGHVDGEIDDDFICMS